jgi:hypothetical protein
MAVDMARTRQQEATLALLHTHTHTWLAHVTRVSETVDESVSE